MNPLVTINLVVLNGEKYIRHCLDGILAQTYPKELIEFNILDNGSMDKTKDAIRDLGFRISNLQGEGSRGGTSMGIASGFARFNFTESKLNLGMWPGQEELLKYSSGKYILAMAVDVILDKDFIKNAIEIMEKDPKIGALQAKIYKYDVRDLEIRNWKLETGGTIDTCGFKIFKSRRVINIGHGLSSAEASANEGFNTDEQQDIFGVEGACPLFRREALESCRIQLSTVTMGTMSNYMVPMVMVTEIFDHDYFWYGDDFDLAWRMNMFGWKQVFVPTVTAWHDRQTTKKLRHNFRDFLTIRRAIPLRKKQLEWKNIRFTIIKNDYIINILKDLPYVLRREMMMLGYIIFFEPKVLLEIFSFLKLLPRMLAKRKEIMRKAKVGPEQIHKWFK